MTSVITPSTAVLTTVLTYVLEPSVNLESFLIAIEKKFPKALVTVRTNDGYHTVTTTNTVTADGTSEDENIALEGAGIISDRRDKTEIEELPLGLDFINKIKPVKFKWNRREESILNGTFEAGFIAQDLLATQEDFDSSWLNLVNTNDPEKYTINPHKMFPIMLKSIQELSAANKLLEERIKMLEDK